MKLSPSIGAFGAGALAAAVAAVAFGPKPIDGMAAGEVSSVIDAAQLRVDRLEASLARLTAQITELGTPVRSFAPAPVAPIALAGSEGAGAPVTNEADRQRVALEYAVGASGHMALQVQAAREYLEAQQNPVARLIEAGFSPARAQDISARHDALLAATQASDPGAVAEPDNLRRILREDLGDAEYERYRQALRLSTAVHIDQVLPGSIAESAGLLSGDVILSYGGRRVMEMRELENIAAENPFGGPVLLEVLRGDERLYISAVHGALGVTERSVFAQIARELEQAGPARQGQGQ